MATAPRTTEVMVPNPEPPAPRETAANETAAIIQVIERAALNPNVDIDKMERLIQMQERIMDRNARASFMAAFAEMQPKLPVIERRGAIRNRVGEVQSEYALWEDINDAIKPILAQYGFGLTFRTGQSDGKIKVVGVLAHRDGHSEETEIELVADTSGSKNAVQSIGSSVSYGKRYTAAALLNLTTKAEDDDGRAGGSEPMLSDDQIADIQALIEEVGADKVRFLRYFKADSLADIPAKSFERAVAMLEAKRARG